MRYLLPLLCLIAVQSAMPRAAAAKPWKTCEDCTLRRHPANDGDSFHVRYKNRSYIFRLYYVDAPETDRSVEERVVEQAGYFDISESDAIRLGKAARAFAEDFLKDGFTVYTKSEDARGRSKKKRYYAMVKAGGKYLSEALVENGLCRIYGRPERRLPNGIGGSTYRMRLKGEEEKAKRNGLGGWGMTRRPANQSDATSERPASDAHRLNALPDPAGKEVVLQRALTVYSLKEPGRVAGILTSGATVEVVESLPAGMVRIRFRVDAKKKLEAQCRRSDLGI